MGRFEAAVDSFRASIEILPTAEGHTFLGWSLSMLGEVEEALAECKKAIALDPDYGNPYNDIGVYLIELGRPEEAIPWLEKAIAAKRYCCYQFAHFNLGRVRFMQGDLGAARRSFEEAPAARTRLSGRADGPRVPGRKVRKADLADRHHPAIRSPCAGVDGVPSQSPGRVASP